MKTRKGHKECGSPHHDCSVMPQHTPGPWSYCYDGSSDWTIGEYPDPQAKPIANIWDKNDERANANARLIAAAPELLEALKIEHQANYETDPKEYNANRCPSCDVIAKAEGK